MVVHQGSLFAGGELVEPRPLGGAAERTDLGGVAWVDLRRSWMAGADTLFERLLDTVAWAADWRPMFDRVVAVPRLQCFFGEDLPLPNPALVAARDALDEWYAEELGERFRTAGMCLYRDGCDSVAWHGDTVGRGATEDTLVAIVSLGAPRSLLLRPRTGSGGSSVIGRRSLRFQLGGGDLLVMGGSCQRSWEHAVPKTRRAVGARISIQFRPRGVR